MQLSVEADRTAGNSYVMCNVSKSDYAETQAIKCENNLPRYVLRSCLSNTEKINAFWHEVSFERQWCWD